LQKKTHSKSFMNLLQII